MSKCPVCKQDIDPNNPAHYAMGWHVVVCSPECVIKAHERLRAVNRLLEDNNLDPDQFSPDCRGPDSK